MTMIPNTRNVIQKWSLDHLHGLDLTDLGRPVRLANRDHQQHTKIMQDQLDEHEKVG